MIDIFNAKFEFFGSKRKMVSCLHEIEINWKEKRI